MASIKLNYKLIFRVCAVIAFFLFAYFFPSMVLYLFLAFILALMGKPIADIIYKVRIKKWRIPYGLCSFIAILLFLVLLTVMGMLFAPMLLQEFTNLENINYDTLATYLTHALDQLQTFLHDNNIMSHEDTIVGIVTAEIKTLINIELFSTLVGGVVNATGNFIMALFTIFFVAFFLIKDNISFDKLVGVFVSDEYCERMTVISDKVNNLLSRYCLGSVIRIVIMIILLYVGLLLFGVKNALFLAFLGGVLNIIPYLGPIIGLLLSFLFGFIDCISMEYYAMIWPVFLKISIVYVIANVIDNVVLQPVIFSQSVKIHPIEVFVITILGGDIAGISGMILAIPVYTIIRIILIEIYNYVNKNMILTVTNDSNFEV
ncbi:AI-2E family transporter [Bacteroidales bacterium OttesenSCG-928-B11]|nr:AI-2E family transporter [Bacteroidales bacterium OttesenSCG-928-E04]MDL2309111.1 AI-2E family transporter [Bacteroidales bacterium OttesenSCG-928-C03]MDL2312944.1 AI-2E family transporter [Bacteroidales bacterium OttesenSCG-928-B11]MDL2326674.1 AI-2E family transporter [Bacteroidales bacterium OttesenSCG-928-A14]